ncbi:MAG TPA: 2-oxoacid:acceptor oxidoreductase family protein, partial [Syntrophorhabdaceae bacterium]|nr:2-oxoacid:acceptor oxidoreductase family protein [Syntrophorhabdaceae bacterium]
MGTVEKLQIVCAGIGGRGVLLASTILMETAIEAGYKAIASDEYGMSQRGGSVVSLVKIGDFASPLIGREKADLLLAFEESEFYKALYLLKPGGTAVINTKLSALPSSVSDLLNRRGIRCCFIDADGCAMDHDMVQASNIALLGFLSSLSIGPYTTESIVDTITRKVPQKFLKKNLEIFDAGVQRAKASAPDTSAQRQAPGAPPFT